MKQPIEPEDIRVGDLVRAENRVDRERIQEGRVESTTRWIVGIGGFTWTGHLWNWFLLDRPQPAPSKKAMVAARVNFVGPTTSGVEAVARRIDEAWAKEGLFE